MVGQIIPECSSRTTWFDEGKSAETLVISHTGISLNGTLSMEQINLQHTLSSQNNRYESSKSMLEV